MPPEPTCAGKAHVPARTASLASIINPLSVSKFTIRFTLPPSLICFTPTHAGILRVSSSNTLRMTGFAAPARGHHQRLLKTPKAKIAEWANKKQTLIFALYSPPARLSLASIGVEAAARFATQIAGSNVLFEQGTGAVLGVAEAFVEDVHDVDADVEANEVG